MSSIIDDYVTVPRSMVKPALVKEMAAKEIKGASESQSQTSQMSSPSVSSASSSSQSSSTALVASRSDVKETKVSNEQMEAVLGRVMKQNMQKGGKRKLATGDVPAQTSLSYYVEYTIPNGPLAYGQSVFIDACSEWAVFSKLYEQYRVVKIVVETVTSQIMFYGAGSVQMHPIASLLTRAPFAYTPTIGQLLDNADTKLLDYGYHKNVFTQSIKPDGAYVFDPVNGWMSQKGWLATSAGGTHAWASIQQQTTGALVGSLGASRPLPHRIKFFVEFRRRREVP